MIHLPDILGTVRCLYPGNDSQASSLILTQKNGLHELSSMAIKSEKKSGVLLELGHCEIPLVIC